MVRWVEAIGTNTARLFERILNDKPHPKMPYRGRMGINPVRGEKVCKKRLCSIGTGAAHRRAARPRSSNVFNGADLASFYGGDVDLTKFDLPSQLNLAPNLSHGSVVLRTRLRCRHVLHTLAGGPYLFDIRLAIRPLTRRISPGLPRLDR